MSTREELEQYGEKVAASVDRLLARGPAVSTAMQGALVYAVMDAVADRLARRHGFDAVRWATEGVGNRLQRDHDRAATERRRRDELQRLHGTDL